MATKHTPGPWKVLEHSWCETSITAPDTPNAICGLDINHATEESQESDEAQMSANARLIAAAPDLLESLDDLIEATEWLTGGRDEDSISDDVCRALKKARAAHDKATGESA